MGKLQSFASTQWHLLGQDLYGHQNLVATTCLSQQFLWQIWLLISRKAMGNVDIQIVRRHEEHLKMCPLVAAGLKGSMKVRGPPPSQGVHIAKAVQEGMRAMFRGVASPTSGSVSDPEPSEASVLAVGQDSIQYEASDPSLMEEYVKVDPEPIFLILVNLEDVEACLLS